MQVFYSLTGKTLTVISWRCQFIYVSENEGLEDFDIVLFYFVKSVYIYCLFCLSTVQNKMYLQMKLACNL